MGVIVYIKAVGRKAIISLVLLSIAQGIRIRQEILGDFTF